MRAARRQLLLVAPPARTAVEAALAGGLVLASLLLLSGDVPPWVRRQGTDLVVLPVAASIAALRLRARGSVPEARDTAALAGLFLLLDAARAVAFGPEPVPRFSSAGGWLFGLLGTGLFLSARLLVRGFVAWRALCRRHLAWALADAHVKLFGLLAALAVSAFALRVATSPFFETFVPPGSGAGTDFWIRVVAGVAPQTLLALLAAVVAMLLLLPPLALLSRLAIGPAARRIERLTAHADAVGEGRLDLRVPVEGEDEVARLEAHLNAMAERLSLVLADLSTERDRVERLLSERRRLYLTLSHDLRTPVAAIRARLEPLAARAEGPERAELDRLLEDVVRLETLLLDLFAVARADAGRLPVRTAACDAAGLARGVVETFRPLAWQRGRVELLAAAEAPLPPVLADPGRLRQVLGNLVHNAVRACPPGGVVLVEAAADAGGVRLSVRDTGPGIPEGTDPFEPRPVAETEDERAGIGLSIVRELAAAMGGRVEARSLPEGGACFSVVLPKAPQERPAA